MTYGFPLGENAMSEPANCDNTESFSEERGMGDLRTVSIKEHPESLQAAIGYFQRRWASEKSRMVYEDCLTHCITATGPLPQWYLLMDEEEIVGGAGLVTNDFISRMDLYPWVCALYVEEAYRGHSHGGLLLAKAKEDSMKGGFRHLYLCTDHVGYYERFGFEKVGIGYHPWGESSSIYACTL
jgi:GNAT superfamily N-acetyltransferase